MKKIQLLLNRIIENEDLNIEDSMTLMTQILQGNLTHVQVAAILVALRMKGESADELVGFITVVRRYMQKIKTSGIVIDTCGTGGDGSGTFNISTAVALIVGGCGVKVAKHGNKAASSLCGSADVLEMLGVNINLKPRYAEECLERFGITFLFAPLYHPAMKYVAAVRKGLGIRTLFNYLGPFVSPAQVKRQIIGVPNITVAKKLVEVARQLDYEHLLILTGCDGLDEISISDKTHIFEIKNKRATYKLICPEDFGLKRGLKEDIRGGNADFNAMVIQKILDGEVGSRRDIVVLNSAAALYVAEKVRSIEEGINLAQLSIKKGRAKEVLKRFREYSQKLI